MSGHERDLFRAVLRQNKREVLKLLEQGADPNRIDKALGLAAVEISELLLAAKADVNLLYDGGGTPLSMAASARDKKKVELFLKHGADVNLTMDTNALTEAVRASYDGKLQMVMQLLDAGADPNIVIRKGEWKGKSCVDLAKEWEMEKVLALFESRAGSKASSKPSKLQAPPKPATIASTWMRIEAEIKRLNWDKSRKLNKGASAASLAKVEKTLGVTLPDEFRESYALHDGQDSGTAFLLGPSDEGYCLLPLAQVLKEAKIWADLKDDFADEEVSADKGIRADWWNTKWLPIAGNGGGDFLCLDLAPAKGGQLGQIITMNHESPTRELWAKSFGEWLHSVAEQLKDVEA